MVFNKLDAFKPESAEGLDQHLATEEDLIINLEKLKNSYLSKNANKVVFVSASKNQNIAELRDVLMEIIQEKHFAIYPNWDEKKNDLYEWQGDSTESLNL